MKKLLLPSICIVALGWVALPALAQNTGTNRPDLKNQEVGARTTGAPVNAAVDSQTADAGELHDVAVTAQHRKGNPGKTALAVSAVLGDTLTLQSITQATDITRLIPSLQIAPLILYTQIYLRGVGTFGFSAFAEQRVAFNLDGVCLSRPAAPAYIPYPRFCEVLTALERFGWLLPG